LSPKQLQITIPAELTARRLDQALSELLPEYSRSRLKQWIDEGQVRVNGRVWRPKDKVAGGETVEITATVPRDERWEAEAIPLSIVYEDEALLVIDKPAHLVVHPAAGNWEGTLLNALLHHAPELAVVPRAGIVHRLDKDTTGLLVVARTLEAQLSLVQQLQERTVSREYEAIVNGVMTAGGTVDAPIDRHPVDRKRMAVVTSGKPAITHYRVAERFRAHTHVRVKLETGRTHQIRVHMAHVTYPLVGDPVYGGRLRLPRKASESLRALLQGFPRQALHAARLALVHPTLGETMEWSSPLPEDMQGLLAALRADAGG
jgi:23S rRNA pseudouridine1911/1915/1917 synthase